MLEICGHGDMLMQTVKILEKDNVKTVSDKKKEALEYFMQMAIKELKPWLVKAILFGSYGMREARDDADIDILMVYYDEGERFLDKVSELSFETSVKYGELIEALLLLRFLDPGPCITQRYRPVEH